MRNASEQKCSYKLPLNPAGVINSGERSGHWIKLRATGAELPMITSQELCSINLKIQAMNQQNNQ
jgi:hypothetical protein